MVAGLGTEVSRGFWLDDALAHEAGSGVSATPLSGDVSAQICIVGGGFTGLWTALRIKELDPAADVVLIDKDICGGGASGRNGGFCMTWMSKAETLLKLTGAQEGVKLLRESQTAVRQIGQFCADHGIDCEFRHDGWVWTASNKAQDGAWQRTIEKLETLGLHPFQALSPGTLRERTGSHGFVSGVYEAGVATVQPARLARGLRRVVMEQGVRIHERTRMIRLERAGQTVVHTDRGQIRAVAVVLALDSWLHELAAFRRHILPVTAGIATTAPVPALVKTLGIADGTAVSDSRFFVNFHRTTPDGRIVYGQSGGPFPVLGSVGEHFDGPALNRSAIERQLARFLPALADVPIDSTWRGPTNRTATGLPFFGRMPGPGRVVYGGGYTGNGVGPSYLGGRFLASLALGLEDEWSGSALCRGPIGTMLPPEPIRALGGVLVRRAAARVDKAQDEGREPGSFDRFLAGFVPSGLVPGKVR